MKTKTLIERLDANINELQHLRNDIHKEELQDNRYNDDYHNIEDAIFVGGIFWAKLNLGSTLSNLNGDVYSGHIYKDIIPNGWKIPNGNDWNKLILRTTSQWINLNGVDGRLFTDKYI